MVFRGEYGFLSNMHDCPVTLVLNGAPHTFQCAEAAFQACKEPARAGEFEALNGPSAKRLGRHVSLSPSWNADRVPYMRMALRAKFTQNPALLSRLKAIPGVIMEENTWHDTYWGVCNGKGANMSGKLLMEPRDAA